MQRTAYPAVSKTKRVPVARSRTRFFFFLFRVRQGLHPAGKCISGLILYRDGDATGRWEVTTLIHND
jgi:hypothetical protein